MQLTFLDWSVIIVYLATLIGMSALIGRSQRGEVDYPWRKGNFVIGDCPFNYGHPVWICEYHQCTGVCCLK